MPKACRKKPYWVKIIKSDREPIQDDKYFWQIGLYSILKSNIVENRSKLLTVVTYSHTKVDRLKTNKHQSGWSTLSQHRSVPVAKNVQFRLDTSAFEAN